jgi:putative ABC transport system permease protein
LPPADARRRARLQFGSIEAAKDAHRDSRGLAWLDALFYDLRFAMRALMHERTFAATAILMLILALGLNVTAFRVLDTMVFRSYPLVKQNHRLLYLNEQYPTPGCCVSYIDFEQWRDQARSFQGMAFLGRKSIILDESGSICVADYQYGGCNAAGQEQWVYPMTWNTFSLLGVRPTLGRDFRPSDEAPGAQPTVIISHRYWKTEMGGRGDVIGRNIRINGVPVTIIGVMPKGFEFPWRNDIYLPLEQTSDLHLPVANGAMAFGRLASGASEKSARAELGAISARLAREFPATNRGVRPVVRNYMESLAGTDAPFLYGAVWVGACFVLWIACANLANLTLARTQGRSRELSIRMALGAGRAPVVRQLFLESLILAAAAGLLAWRSAAWSTRVWAAATVTPNEILDYSASIGTVVYLMAVTLVSAGIITLASIAGLWRLDLNGALKGESRGSTMSRGARRLSAALVAGQMALAIVLMAGAGLLGRSLWKVLAADVGVKEPENVLVGRIALPQTKYPTPESHAAFAESLRARLATVPGVESAAVSDGRPADDFEPRPFELDSPLASPLESKPGAIYGVPVFASGPGYFQTIGAAILAGRDFNRFDRPGTPLVAIVNRRFAETYFPGQNPIGRRFRLYKKAQPESGQWRTIVGIVSNIMQNEWTRQHFVPAAYLPFAQEREPSGSAWFFARTRSASDGTAAAIRAEVKQMSPSLEIRDFSTLKATLDLHSLRNNGDYGRLVQNAAVAPIFAAIGLLVAAMGLYAVVARSVGRRTKEIGVRMALGAAPRAIERLVLSEGMRPVAAGLVLGLPASLAANRVLESQLVGISPYDALTLSLAPVTLTLVALLACLAPLRQAVQVDPAVALRHD